MARKANTLAQARKVLDPRPLAFDRPSDNPAENPEFYEDLPERNADGPLKLPGPIEAIQDRLLNGGRETKMFLSGHVGSGKSTQLARLTTQGPIRELYTIVSLRFEESEWATLDSSQVLFRMAAAIFDKASKLQRLTSPERWEELLEELDSHVLGARGMPGDDDKRKVEWNLYFVKVTQDLRLNESLRRQFKDLGETLKSLLIKLMNELADDFETNLAKHGEPAGLLLVVDDLDKVRTADNQTDIFETNLNSLLVLPFRAVYTVPSGVAFGGNRADLRQNKEHLYPIKVIGKFAELDLEKAYLPDSLDFFLHLIKKRVEPGIIDNEAVRLAALYSGGVLRDFFRLLREGIKIAQFNKLDVLDALTMKAAIKNEKLRDSAGLYAPDFGALRQIHDTHHLRSDSDRHYLDESRVIECYNDQNWFEVNPLLWSLLPAPESDGRGD